MTEQSVEQETPKSTPAVDAEAQLEAPAAKTTRYALDLEEVDIRLQDALAFLGEALRVLELPEIYGLLDPRRQHRALEKLRRDVERGLGYVESAREVSELVWHE